MSRQYARNGTARFRSLAIIGLGALAALACASLCPAQQPATAGKPAAAPVTILDGSSVWRVLYSWGAPMAKTRDGYAETRGKDLWDFMTVYPPDGWTAVTFDDSTWCRRHFFGKYYNGELDGRAGGGGPNLNIRQISLRGKFTVTDPAKVKVLHLTLVYRGGVVVHVNGREVKRDFLPPGKLVPGCPAEMYPTRAYLNDQGKPWSWWDDRKVIGQEAYQLRVRRINGLPVPAELLRKGTNVLAIEIHAAPFPEAFTKPKVQPNWAAAGLCELRLQTDDASVVIPNVVRPEGMQVWNTNLVEQIGENSYGDPHEPVKPVRLGAARNGVTTGRLIVSSDRPIKGLKATVSELAGSGGKKIASSAVQVRYGKICSLNGSGRRDDALLDAPPQVLSPPPAPPRDNWTAMRHKARTDDGLPPEIKQGAIQSVLVTARVPKDAEAGAYRGTLTIAADGERPVEMPLELTAADWVVPDPADFTFWFGLIQSPEGVALRYDVPLWSQAHLKLLDKSFRLIAQTGGKVLFIHLIAETEYGNERSMVIWDKGPDGKLTADLSAVEKFVKVAAEHMKPTYVVVCVWQWQYSGTSPRITVRDPETGALANVPGPKYGTPESLAFWKPVLLGVKDMLAKAGLDGRMLLGSGSDGYPKKDQVSVFKKIVPDVGWEAHRHPPRGGNYMVAEEGNVPVKYIASVWGSWSNWDPASRRVYGWNFTAGGQGTFWTWLDRRTYDPAGFTRFRTLCEQTLLANRRGLAQIGADFWPPPAEKGTRPLGTLFSRFPHAGNVGAGNKGCTTNQLFYPAPEGPVPTIRYELIRENIQECEARIFLEKLLLEKPCRLSEGLAQKYQDLLDERTRWHRIGYGMATSDVDVSWPYSGWRGRTMKLYEAAGEAAKAVAGK